MEDKEFNEMKETVDEICSNLQMRMIKMDIELKQDMLNDVTDYIFLSGKSDVETIMFVLKLCNNLGIDVEGTLKLNEHKVEVLNLTDVEIHKGKKD